MTKSMQRGIILPALALLAMSGCVATVPVVAEPVVVGESYGYGALPPDYYGHLHGYGTWRTVPGYGTIWCPAVASVWTPYYYGPLAPWSFTFYYGDWVSTPYGWGWVPGRDHHPHWHHWSDRGNPRHWNRHGHDGRGYRNRPRYETQTPPRGAISPGTEGRTPPASVRPLPPVRALPNARPRSEPPSGVRPTPPVRALPTARPRPEPPSGDGARQSPYGETVRPLPPVRSPGVPIAEPPPNPMPPRRFDDGRGSRIEAPRPAFVPSRTSPSAAPPAAPNFGRSRPSPGFTGGGRGSGSSPRGVPRGRW